MKNLGFEVRRSGIGLRYEGGDVLKKWEKVSS
jgi:hypothetical protein